MSKKRFLNKHVIYKNNLPISNLGENCQHPDGTLIKKGEVYHPDSHTVCKCPTTSFHFGAPVAMCATSITGPVQTVS